MKKNRKQHVVTYLNCLMYFRSLQPLFENPKLDNELRVLVRANFLEFMSPTDGKYLLSICLVAKHTYNRNKLFFLWS